MGVALDRPQGGCRVRQSFHTMMSLFTNEFVADLISPELRVFQFAVYHFPYRVY